MSRGVRLVHTCATDVACYATCSPLVLGFVPHVDLWRLRHGYPAETPLATCSAAGVLGYLRALFTRKMQPPYTGGGRHHASSDRAPHSRLPELLETPERDQLK